MRISQDLSVQPSHNYSFSTTTWLGSCEYRQPTPDDQYSTTEDKLGLGFRRRRSKEKKEGYYIYSSHEECQPIGILCYCCNSRFGMDWLHCNVCFTLPSANCIFLLTSCKHIVCAKCVIIDHNKTTPPDVCPVCKKKIKFAKIDKNLSPKLRILFKPQMTYVEESIAKIKRISAFQQMQKKRLLGAQSRQMNTLYAQYEPMEAKFQQLKVEAKAIQTKTDKLNASAKEKEELIEIFTELLAECDQQDMRSGLQSRPSKRKHIDDDPAAHSSSSATPMLTLPVQNNETSTPFDTVKIKVSRVDFVMEGSPQAIQGSTHILQTLSEAVNAHP